MTPPLLPSVERVLSAVAQSFDVTAVALQSKTRVLRIAHSRQAAMYILRQMDFSLNEIGQILGGRDHTTVIWGCSQAERRAIYNPHYAACLAEAWLITQGMERMEARG